MTALLRTATLSSLARLSAHLRMPLFRNGYALILSSASTSALGMVYWILAARYYTTEAVGLNAAALSSMFFLANISQFNLMNALNQFLSRAGQATGRFILQVYGLSLGTALAASLLFLAVIGWAAPALGYLRSSPVVSLWFVAATMTWCLFVLQDSVLTGLRQATWVPLENVLFALAKIGLLVGLASLLPFYGLLASWTIPVVAALLPVNLLIFFRLVPRHVRATRDRAQPLRLRTIVRFVAGDYLGSLFWMSAISLLPLMVTQRAGASANAYYYLCWTMAYSLYLVSRNMGMALIAEAAADETQLSHYSYRVFVQTARLLVPVVAVIALGAPFLLRLFGNSYSVQGTTLLRLLALSALPNIVTALALSVARVQRRMKTVIAIMAAICGLVLALSSAWLKEFGVVGVGAAWLVSQSLVAATLLLTQLRPLWTSRADAAG